MYSQLLGPHGSRYLQSADDLLHLGPAQVQEALDQVPVDEARGLLRLTLRVERPPGAEESRKTTGGGDDV